MGTFYDMHWQKDEGEIFIINWSNLSAIRDSQLRKESLSREGQQFTQYQQNEQPPITSNHWAQNLSRHFPAPCSWDPYPF